jgi:uncharacterized damage-inducible protein DinB
MADTTRVLEVRPPAGYDPQVATWVWVLEDTRGRTLRALEDLPEGAIDRSDAASPNSIGTLLYHIAAIELDWVFADILGKPFPLEATTLFPVDVREEGGRLSPLLGEGRAQHLARLAAVRATCLAALRDLHDSDLHVHRAADGYTCTPAWVFQHLAQHEAEHRGQIGELRARFAA